MSKKGIGVVLGALVIAALVFYIVRSKEESLPEINDGGVNVEASTNEKRPQHNDTTSAVPVNPPLIAKAIDSGKNSGLFASGGWSNEEIKLLEKLNTTYRPGGLPARIRMQDQLSKIWIESPPTTDQMLSLVSEDKSPPEMRIYMAKVLKNQIKRKAYEEDDRFTAIVGLQTLVESTAQPELFRSELAMILTAIDQGDKTILAVLPLLDSSDDETAARAVAALCNTTNAMAIQGLYDFVQGYEKFQNTKPNALAFALAPLSTVSEYDVVPVILGVVSTTDDMNLMRTSIQCLGRVPSSKAVLETIVTAHDSASKIPDQAPYIEYLSRAALGAHTDFIKENEQTIETSILDKIQEIKGAQ